LKGVQFGRRRSIDRGQILSMREKGTGATEIARQLKISRSTVYKIINEIPPVSAQVI
ncbi:helix-turn-helix domain-containing protein, partial [Klebsiella variicola]|uniref:helix-turn-helix domain-containing protein n=1 Tax=Klebsiella variicola TaxID=244366 RepID=UPI001CCB5A80